MDLDMFLKESPGALVPITGTDPMRGAWEHRAFVPDALPETMPPLSPETFLAVANARAAIAALDSTASRLPEPGLLRSPTLRREAQSTSALEGTYAPLEQVLTADEEDPSTAEMTEILNYVRMAETGFYRVAQGWPLSVSVVAELQGILMRGTPLEEESGRLRAGQVVIGLRSDVPLDDVPVRTARFVPSPPGADLEVRLRDLIDWMQRDHGQRIDPIVAAAMAHYQFETLHPFRDGNGRIGRYLIVLHLLAAGVLSEPTLTVSPWFEARRAAYYDHLLGVSARADWDSFIRFFAEGVRSAADGTRKQMVALVDVQSRLHDLVRESSLRSGRANELIDFAVSHLTFTVRMVESALGISYGRANTLVGQLVDLGVLAVVDPDAYKRRFFAPQVLQVLTSRTVA
ncbi:Fic family protein [Brachybacterium sp. J153]|uniref:Fic family protein n=1 Tax=Brachybacterium sp. J153 TaxID=3116488 RepID=UPI002E79ABF0|nr:Fic/DOC family N-terminal domain-containing protein [Brachybacterium sp. J153]MEE1618733.1 Fic/DOC family N-terminal domain-containing protein [Brachybacterium sp. J153]